MLNKQGPSLIVHCGVIFGRTPHVTAAFFKVEDTSDARFRLSSSPGGPYHPFQAKALKAKENELWILLEDYTSNDKPSAFQAVRIFTNIAFLISEAMILAATNAILATS